jgi:hypothetical protein
LESYDALPRIHDDINSDTSRYQGVMVCIASTRPFSNYENPLRTLFAPQKRPLFYLASTTPTSSSPTLKTREFPFGPRSAAHWGMCVFVLSTYSTSQHMHSHETQISPSVSQLQVHSNHCTWDSILLPNTHWPLRRRQRQPVMASCDEDDKDENLTGTTTTTLTGTKITY